MTIIDLIVTRYPTSGVYDQNQQLSVQQNGLPRKRQPVLQKGGRFSAGYNLSITVSIAFAATAKFPTLDNTLTSEPDLNITPVLSNGNFQVQKK
jgi:hypothetical protein